MKNIQKELTRPSSYHSKGESTSYCNVNKIKFACDQTTGCPRKVLWGYSQGKNPVDRAVYCFLVVLLAKVYWLTHVPLTWRESQLWHQETRYLLKIAGRLPKPYLCWCIYTVRIITNLWTWADCSQLMFGLVYIRKKLL